MHDIHYYAYYQLLYQVLSGLYLTQEQDIDVLIPLAPHLTWYRLFAHILVLDATASLTLQELYRTRIREGHPITLLVMGEREALALLQQTLGITLWPSTIGGPDNPDGLEALLQQVHAKVEQALLQQLLTKKVVEMKAFARQHTNYDTRKVQRALRGILQCHPRFEGHVIEDETTIRLIDKPAPLR
jgi:hypothetical protein